MKPIFIEEFGYFCELLTRFEFICFEIKLGIRSFSLELRDSECEEAERNCSPEDSEA